MTGLYPQNTPLVTNDIPMYDSLVTFAEALQDQGYLTGYAGKWHLDGEGKPQWAPERKFGFADNRYMFNRGHWKQLEETDDGPRVAARDNNDQPTYSIEGSNDLNYTTDFLTQKAIEFISDNKGEPFCYMVSYPDPHGPNTVRPPYDTMYDHLDFKKPRTGFKSEEDLPLWAKKSDNTISKAGMSQYFGMVKCIDDNVGKILEALRKTGQIEHTIIVFTADHGDLCGEHGRDNKGIPYEASARIPFLLYYPQKVEMKTIVDEALTCVDFMPTILRLMDVPAVAAVQGRDASALFVKDTSSELWNDVAFIRGTGQRGAGRDINWFGAVTDRYKLIYSPTDDPWLFDLREDPDELINFYGVEGNQAVIRALSKAILEYGEQNNDPRINIGKIRNELVAAIN